MDELQGRFRRLDRVETPNLWNEAVARAAELELAPRRAFNPGMGLIAAALLLAALAGTVAIGAWLDRQSPTTETVTYDNGMVVSYVECGGLVAIDQTSSQQRGIGPEPSRCQIDNTPVPAWSRDGRRLAFFVPPSQELEAGGVWIYEAATGETRQVGECRFCGATLDISPDASLIAYADFDDGIALAVVEVDSGQTYRVPLIGQPGRAEFSPDGSHVAIPLLGGTSGVHLIDVSLIEDGVVGSPTLVHGIVEASDVSWSPDGRWIAMTQAGGLRGVPFDGDRTSFNWAGRGIVIARADGTEARILTRLPAEGGGGWPTWAADSTSLAYLAMPDSDALEVWTVPIDGGEPERIYESGCCVSRFGRPAWSPDGEWIAFGVEVPGNPSESGSFLLRPDGSEMREVSGSVLDLVWQPIPRD